MVKHGGNVYGRGMAPDSLLDFSSNINDFVSGSRYSMYPEIDLKKYKEKIADYARVKAENIAIGPGLNYFISHFIDFYSIRWPLIIKPAFSEYEKVASSRKLEYSNLNIDILSSRPNVINNYRYDALFIVTPVNPTGELIDIGIMEKICETSARMNAYVFIDDAFGDFVPEYSEKLAKIALNNRYVFVGRSLTKMFAMPSLRLGYLISDRSNIENIENLMETWPVCQPALDFISGTDMEYVRNRTIRRNERELKFMISKLQGMGFRILGKPVANYVSFLIEKPEEFENFALKRGILVRVLDDFPELGGKAVRIAIKKRNKNMDLVNTISDYLNFVKNSH
ncbi:MAG: aminotransferase class I/II-fold pyridoxal phosphate-dependent enzyme [Thermoplasmata archaeon]